MTLPSRYALILTGVDGSRISTWPVTSETISIVPLWGHRTADLNSPKIPFDSAINSPFSTGSSRCFSMVPGTSSGAMARALATLTLCTGPGR